MKSLHAVLGMQEDLVKAETPDSKDSAAQAQLARGVMGYNGYNNTGFFRDLALFRKLLGPKELQVLSWLLIWL